MNTLLIYTERKLQAYSSDLSYVRPRYTLLAQVVMQLGFPAITLGSLFTGWLPEKPLVVFSIYDEKNKLDRKVALELYSKGSAWFLLVMRGKRNPCSRFNLLILLYCLLTTLLCQKKKSRTLNHYSLLWVGRLFMEMMNLKGYHLNCRQHHLIGHRREFMVMVVLT